MLTNFTTIFVWVLFFLAEQLTPIKNPKQNPDDSTDFVFHLSSSTHISNQFFGGTLQLNKTGVPELFIYLKKKKNQARAKEAFSPNEA